MRDFTFSLVEATIEKLVEMFGLTEWRVDVIHGEQDTKNEITINTMRPGKMVTFIFNDAYESKITDFRAREIATYAVIRLIMNDMEYLVQEEGSDSLYKRFLETESAAANRLANYITNREFSHVGERGIPGDPKGPEC